MLAKKGSIDSIKVIDFGLSKHFEKTITLKTSIGTELYAAPEVYKDKYTEKCDIWSCGVIIYILLSGLFPFSNTEEIIGGTVRFDGSAWEKISEKTKDYIRLLL